ncbi:unnamed protein product [Rhizophagus irregularis]|uniref:Uncharacterized protein n=1 Tax=Rhizophagus irregularis TaxID=588596 RepID=A0A2N1N8P2_9GLOM|nr:hypothetical protein RhiirC2_472094 [Rhizophagus irregularis]CAB4385060.1 unnamed protein product [Rhizophagus irregularis]CAB4406547.1 unnamed protein product [Rhizophagus irregularis]CAB5312912.1 unnamed protein product [Rhizophagus irregularis]
MTTNQYNSITCFKLSTKENEIEKIFYVRSNWKVNPFKDLLGRDEKIICDLSLTDCKSFWARNVTLLDLKNTKPDNIRNPKDFCEATQAALSGNDKYGNQKLSCNIIVNEQHAKITWNWSMQQTGKSKSTMELQFTLGSISLNPVSQFETIKMWQEWMDFFIEERNQLLKSKITYELRVNDLEEIKGQMQEKIESITDEKIHNQTLLIEKFKKVMNTKKKKVKKLMKVLNANGAIMSSELQASHDEHLDENEFEEELSNESESSKHANTRGKSSRPLPTDAFSPSKKTKVDDAFESKSTIASESTNEEDQEELQEIQPQKRPESVLTKTFRGQVIKSRRMGRKPVTRSSNSLENILVPVEEPEPSPEIEEVKEAEDLLDQIDQM